MLQSNSERCGLPFRCLLSSGLSERPVFPASCGVLGIFTRRVRRCGSRCSNRPQHRASALRADVILAAPSEAPTANRTKACTRYWSHVAAPSWLLDLAAAACPPGMVLFGLILNVSRAT